MLLIPWVEVSSFAALAMNACFFAFWFVVFSGQPPRPSYSFTVAFFLGLILGAYALAGWLNSRSLSKNRRAVLLGIVMLITLLLAMQWLAVWPQSLLQAETWAPLWAAFVNWGDIPAAFWVVAAALLTWRCALSIAAEGAPEANLLQVLFYMMLLSMLLYDFFPSSITVEEVGFTFYMILVSGMVAASAARLAEVNGMRGSRLAPFTLTWLGGLVGTATVMVLAGTLLALAMHAGLINLVLGVFTFIVVGLGGLLALLLLPVADVIISLFMTLLTAVFNFFNLVGLSDWLKKAQDWLDSNELAFLQQISTLMQESRPYALLAMILALAALVFLALRIRKYGRISPVDNLASGLRPPREGWLPRLRRFNSLPNFLHRSRQVINALRIRRIYAEFLALCKKQQCPRTVCETPLEFQIRALRAFPNSGPDLAAITSAYLRIRYGELPESDQEVSTVLKAWNHFKRQVTFPKTPELKP
ncbi:MAG TPA: DUF4129 domain-containing protein [Anaerolineaceae bacterium]|nr:DUF4129 domain-containing protein [Anaerolineaceae bacterium]HPN51252.1 DUF4129 domain-containing protein [Anaerolineaceae bacterium]